MKRSLRSMLFLLLAVCTLTVTAFADMGPKEQLVVKVENAPQELYYLDLLQKTGHRPGTFKDTMLNAPLVTLLQDSVPNGWWACLAQPVSGSAVSGELTGTQHGDMMLHTFGYSVPNPYKILIATESGEVWMSKTYTRTVLQSSVTLDWETKTVTIPSTLEGYLLQFLATFVPTLLMEGLILLLFRYRQKRSWAVFGAVNLATQGALAATLSVAAIRLGVGWGFYSLLLMAETLVVIVESAAYMVLLKERSKSRAVFYGIVANIASAAISWLISEPVWRFVVSIS